MNSRELATVLAALHYWRREGLMSAGHEHDIASNGDTIQPLNEEEIHSLCDRLKIEPEANKLLRSIVADVQAMRGGQGEDDFSPGEEDPTWFVRFPEGYYNSDEEHYGVCWPNLAILADQAQQLLDGQPAPQSEPLRLVVVPEDAWEDSGDAEDPNARLCAQIQINGCPMHLEAYAVEYGEKTETTYGEQHFADGCTFEDCEHGFYSFVEGAARSIKIKGREYVLIATPHQA